METRYTLTVESNVEIDQVIEDIEFFLDAAGAFEVVARNQAVSAHDFTRWPDHDHDLTEVSRMHPDSAIKLTGVTEEGDEFEKVYLNGELEEVVGTCV
jgi:hypothetical protein